MYNHQKESQPFATSNTKKYSLRQHGITQKSIKNGKPFGSIPTNKLKLIQEPVPKLYQSPFNNNSHGPYFKNGAYGSTQNNCFDFSKKNGQSNQ